MNISPVLNVKSNASGKAISEVGVVGSAVYMGTFFDGALDGGNGSDVTVNVDVSDRCTV